MDNKTKIEIKIKIINKWYPQLQKICDEIFVDNKFLNSDKQILKIVNYIADARDEIAEVEVELEKELKVEVENEEKKLYAEFKKRQRIK